MTNQIDPLWLLADSLSVRQAAALIAGYEPGDVDWMGDETIQNQDFPRQYAAEIALRNAVLSGFVPDLDGPASLPDYIDDGPEQFSVTCTRVSVSDVRSWLARGATRPPRLLRGQWQSEIRVIGG